MDWKARLTAIVLAGGGALACSSSTPATTPHPIPSCNGNPDPCCGHDGGVCLFDTDAGAVDGGTAEGGNIFDAGVLPQCNGNPDPCCGHTSDSGVCSLKDGGPDGL